MITDKDEARRLVTHAFNAIRFESESFIVSDFVPPVEKAISRIRRESADQARKEAEELYVRQYEELRTWNAERSTSEGWHDMIDRHKNERAAILGNSTDNEQNKTDVEKLAIAVKALEDIVYLYAGDASIIARNALKEIQG
jgi:hypothetical protein